jgi:hypothetical protein
MRRLSPVMVIGTLAFLAGCGPGEPTVLREANWVKIRGSDATCVDEPTLVADDYYDLNGDGRDETFLTLKCTAKSDPPGHQFEVVESNGDLSRTHPHKLVLQVPPAVVDRVCFSNLTATYRVTIAGRSEIWQVRWRKGEPGPDKPTRVRGRGCP